MMHDESFLYDVFFFNALAYVFCNSLNRATMAFFLSGCALPMSFCSQRSVERSYKAQSSFTLLAELILRSPMCRVRPLCWKNSSSWNDLPTAPAIQAAHHPRHHFHHFQTHHTIPAY